MAPFDWSVTPAVVEEAAGSPDAILRLEVAIPRRRSHGRRPSSTKPNHGLPGDDERDLGALC
jgi:hypothetical protein